MKYTAIVMMCTVLFAGCAEPVQVDSLQDDSRVADQLDNAGPTISGKPEQAVLQSDIYRFRPKATDADGDTLTFSVANKPDWATFDAATGALIGQPDSENVGLYDNIVISVSDGVESDSLPSFSITVSKDALGSATLTWLPPTENSDGTALTDLDGYFLYIGEESGVYLRKIRIKNPGVTSYVVDNLLPDTYYFAASSYNSSGLESDLSLEASTIVN